ncbi:hypothetical protein K469DRAFT_614459, partial [Zopfia rhizophila CBS 207.26]
LLPPSRHVIWLDNLFTTVRLLERLREDGIGGAGTVRTIKTSREKTEESRRRKHRGNLSESSQSTLKIEINTQKTVGQLAWKDNNVVLFATTVGDLQKTVIRLRKRPSKTQTSAIKTRRMFRDYIRKKLSIPKLVDLYNHYMNLINYFN